MEEPSPRQVQAQVRNRAEAEDSLSRQSRAQQQRQWQAVVRLGRRLRPYRSTRDICRIIGTIFVPL